jgi:hypothetical protein
MSQGRPELPEQSVERTRVLRSMVSTEELRRRPSRCPDYAAENRALIALAQALATSPEDIVQRLAETALSLCQAHSAGLSLLEDGDRTVIFTGVPSPGSGRLT